MKINLLAFFLLLGTKIVAQCPAITVDLTGGHCAGDTLIMQASGRVRQIVWYKGSQVVKMVTAGTPSPFTIVAGGNGMGGAANQLNLPSQIYVDGNDNLYVSDQENFRVQQFPAGSTSATNGSMPLAISI